MNYPVALHSFYCLAISLIVSVSGYAQSDSAIVASTLSGYTYTTPHPRAVMKVRKTSGKLRLNPLYYIGTGAMFMYQRVFSEQISADCQYAISCSEYTKKHIELHGLIYGSLIGIHQLHHCTGLTAAEIPEHRLNSHGKIINPVE